MLIMIEHLWLLVCEIPYLAAKRAWIA
jgi:hypothetical protein